MQSLNVIKFHGTKDLGTEEYGVWMKNAYISICDCQQIFMSNQV
jgi:hypothetical protein